jgi:hypothetical protein
MDKQTVKDKAEERTSLSKVELWMLRIAAATGIVGMLSHAADLLHEIGLL